MREEHWVVADLHGKAGYIRTIPIPNWVKSRYRSLDVRQRHHRRLPIRAINKARMIWGPGRTPKVLWEVVRKAAKIADIEKLAAHDL